MVFLTLLAHPLPWGTLSGANDSHPSEHTDREIANWTGAITPVPK